MLSCPAACVVCGVQEVVGYPVYDEGDANMLQRSLAEAGVKNGSTIMVGKNAGQQADVPNRNKCWLSLVPMPSPGHTLTLPPPQQ